MKECLSEELLQQYFDGELRGMRLESAVSHLEGCGQCAASLDELQQESHLVATALAVEFDVAVPTERLHRRIGEAIAGRHLFIQKPARVSTPAWRRFLGPFSASFWPQRVAFGGLAAAVVVAIISVIAVWQEPASPVPRQPSVVVAPAGVSASVANVTDKAVNEGPRVADDPVTIKTPRRPRRTTSNPVSDSAEVAEVKLLPGERSYLKTIAALDSTIKSGNMTMRPALQAEYERNLALVDRAIAATRSAAKRNPDDPDAADFMFAAYQSKVDLLSTIADARVYNRPR